MFKTNNVGSDRLKLPVFKSIGTPAELDPAGITTDLDGIVNSPPSIAVVSASTETVKVISVFVGDPSTVPKTSMG